MMFLCIIPTILLCHSESYEESFRAPRTQKIPRKTRNDVRERLGMTMGRLSS
jgi:hypothetical protein